MVANSLIRTATVLILLTAVSNFHLSTAFAPHPSTMPTNTSPSKSSSLDAKNKNKIVYSISSTDEGTTFTDNTSTSTSTNTNTKISSSSLPKKLPSLIVFDLDNTFWTPELFQLRKLQRSNTYPVAHEDVKLFPPVRSIINSIRYEDSNIWKDTKFAVASRTKSVEWAHDLLSQFGLTDFFDHLEIFPGDKKKHFANLKQKSGIPYNQMLFFDDNRDGKFGNCVPVSQLGVLSVHCPGGIHTEKVFTDGLERYEEWIDLGRSPNSIVEWDGSMTVASKPERFKGVVKFVNEEKRFGFIEYGDRKTRDMFFHFNDLPDGLGGVNEGTELGFAVVTDKRKNKDAARDIEVLSSSSSSSNSKDTVNMRVFSMNLPFAALLANEYKTLETRNGTMFVPYPEGTKMLLHVGQRIYPDGDRHIDVMKSGGLSDAEIAKLKSLPEGYTKGMAVAIVELGKTRETTLEERCDPDFERKVAAFGADSGMRATEIKRVAYLKRGVRVSGRGGVFKSDVDRDVIPDGWL